jgi:amino acid transporter
MDPAWLLSIITKEVLNMATKTQEPQITGDTGLKSNYLSFVEVLGQSIGGIAPSATPALVIPLVFATAGNGTWLTYAFATVAILLVGLSLNQFAHRSASPGSLYSYVAKGLGPGPGVIAGWALVFAYTLTASAVLVGFVNYAVVLLAFAHIFVPRLALGVIGIVSAWYIGFKDIKLSTIAQLGLEFISLLLILALAFVVLGHHHFAINTAQLTLKGVSVKGLQTGLVLAFFSFTCFESSATLGEEAKDPLKTIPRSITTSILIVGGIFILLSFVEVLGFVGKTPTLDAAAAPLANLSLWNSVPFFGPLISVGALISFWACVVGCTNAAARVLYQLGRHNVVHSNFGKAHASNQTPHIAITIVAVITYIVPAVLLAKHQANFDIYGWVGTIATFGFLLNYLLIAIAAPFYLKKEGELKLSGIVLAVVTSLILLVPIVGSVYPLPTGVAVWFPVIFLAWIAVGAIWYFVRRSTSNIVSDINSDLDAVHAHYKEVREGDDYV